ncbi:hypothetical protein T4D_1201 [Trichinella pseudospiralis]|uniref:Uncharacterized protein n=1 Tax=Trichinella pseudospiralis TaxID=6337 RepID=A0A0V1G267_TRIPS|nr:hypothetical protein T4D_1201 [Trichinella pseudospiralis]
MNLGVEEAPRNSYRIDEIKRSLCLGDRKGHLTEKIVEVAHSFECLLKATLLLNSQSKRRATTAEIVTGP